MNRIFMPALAGAAFLLNGCVAKAAWDVATLPVKAGSKAVDMATTSQSEADRNYGKKMREKEAREGRERREWEKACKQERRKDCDRYDGYRADH